MTLHTLLHPGAFFDFAAHPFAHKALFTSRDDITVIDVLDMLGAYCVETLATQHKACTYPAVSLAQQCHVVGTPRVLADPSAVVMPDRIIGGEETVLMLGPGVSLIGGTYDLSCGSIAIGARTKLHGAWVCGPTLIGEETEVRPGAYFRGNVLIGDGCTLRGEIKNSVIMNNADFPHPSYLGDSICGWHSHFGNQATAANVNIFGKKTPLSLVYNGEKIALKRRKIGIIMGDECQVGCNSVSDPATFLRPRTIAYSLCRISAGIYGPDEILKNKPLTHGVIERAPLRHE